MQLLNKMVQNDLVEEILGAYQNHITNLIGDFKQRKGLDSMTEVGNQLGYKSDLLSAWFTQKVIVSFPKYFGLRLSFDGENSSKRTELQASLEDHLKKHVANSISHYRGLDKKPLRKVAEELGYSASTIIDLAAGRIMSSPKTTFGILSKTFAPNKGIVGSILGSIINIYPLGGTNQPLDVARPSGSSFNTIEDLMKYQPTSVGEQVELFDLLLKKLGSSVSYFSGTNETERNMLRAVLSKKEVLMIVLMRARQLIRTENDYQSWEDMQRMMNDGGLK